MEEANDANRKLVKAAKRVNLREQMEQMFETAVKLTLFLFVFVSSSGCMKPKTSATQVKYQARRNKKRQQRHHDCFLRYNLQSNCTSPTSP